MLHLHFSNRFETLRELLLQRLGSTPRGAFEADAIVVPSAAVRRALTLAIADHDGVCANVRFDYLARWLWQQIGRLVPGTAGESPFDAGVLAWRVYRAFGDAAFVAPHPRLASYLREADDVMRLELAQRTASLLEQTITYRDDWLEAWRRHLPADLGAAPSDTARADAQWQAALWRRLADELGLAGPHPAAAFAEALAQAGPGTLAAAGLPSIAHVFALPTMPPLHIGLLQQIGHVAEVHVYVLNPCQEYWFELVDARRLAHLALRGRASGHEVGNRLLAAWGRQTQSHIDLLVERSGGATTDDAAFEPNPAPTLLAAVQNAILDLTELAPGSFALAGADRSLEVHVCHSLTRELEALQDHLLGLFAAEAEQRPGATPLRPADILVVVPDLEAAAPLIDAVFGCAPSDRHLPFSVTGRARSRVNVPARTLLELLALAGSRLPASALFALLQQGIVARRFGLDDEALQQVHDWVRASGMRWGLDATHRTSFGLPADPGHTLQDGFDRLFLGYALPDSAHEPFDDRLPAGAAEGVDALALGAFWRFVDALAALQLALAVPQAPAAWRAHLLTALDTFFAPAGDELDDLRELQGALRELGETMRRGGVSQPLPLAVVRHALEQALDDPARGGVPTGSITFSSMTSLRNLPFRVVCALGLNDGAFPTSARAPEFDLMALHPRRGDRQRRDDERNLFLDLLLAARDSLYLSHTGRSVRDNAPLPPSVLVSELLEAVLPAISTVQVNGEAAPGAGSAAATLAEARARLVVEHPLQPFSIEAFSIDADPRIRSFNRELGEALRHSLHPAREIGAATTGAVVDTGRFTCESNESDDAHEGDEAAARADQPPFFTAPLATPGPEWREVTLAQLVEFFRQPDRYLLRRRLGIELPREADELLDDEPFLPDFAGRRALAQRLLPALLSGAGPDEVHRLARAGTELPGGALGERQLRRELDSLGRFAERVRAATREPVLPPHAVHLSWPIDGQDWHLRAAFAELRPAGALRWAHAPLRAGDALEAWLQHLMLSAAPAAGAAPQTRWLLKDETLVFTPFEAATAAGARASADAALHDLMRLYRLGLQRPLHFFPKSAWAFSENRHLSKARAVWQVSADRPHGESADAYHRLALRGHAEPLDGEFERLALAVFGPLREHLTAEVCERPIDAA
jgi:exodeoxyribonuclease V gamma subunit